MPGAVSSVSVEAAEETEVLFLKIDRLLRGDLPPSAQQSRILQNLLLDMAGKTLLLNGKVTHLSQRSTRARLLSYLSEQARRSAYFCLRET